MLFIVLVASLLAVSLIEAVPLPSPEIRPAHVEVPFLKRYTLLRDPEGKMSIVDLYPETEIQNIAYIVDPDKVTFYFYSQNNTGEAVKIFVNDKEALLKAGFNPNFETKFIVHGFMNNVNSDTVQSIKNNLFLSNREQYNVIAVDWSSYTLVYLNVISKAEGVGNLIGEFMNFLLASELTTLERLHCMGHSLGAHACGFAGKAVTAATAGKISRISGMDPALPGFDVDDHSRRLTVTDATFVDCIHTCGGFLGMEDPICDADFYPNSGKDQPGCHWYDFGSCSHGRSHEFYAESILNDHIFPAFTCYSQDLSPDNCVFKGAIMGYPATHEFLGIFSLETNAEYPYAKNWTLSSTQKKGAD